MAAHRFPAPQSYIPFALDSITTWPAQLASIARDFLEDWSKGFGQRAYSPREMCEADPLCDKRRLNLSNSEWRIPGGATEGDLRPPLTQFAHAQDCTGAPEFVRFRSQIVLDNE